MGSLRMALQHAEFEYRKFCANLSASPASNTSVRGGHDAPVTVPVEVKRQEVLNCFLKKKPQFEPFRAQLEAAASGRKLLSLDSERWAEMNASA